MAILGTPSLNPITETSKGNSEPVAGSFPRYLVYPVDWCKVSTSYISSNIVLIDFGQAFRMSQPPKDIGIPRPYRSPELLLDHTVGSCCDIWALGCTIFTIRTGRVFFDAFDDDDDEYLEDMVTLLGKMPEPWWSDWSLRKEVFKDETDEDGQAISLHEPYIPKSHVTIHPSVAHGARSIKDKLAPGVWYLSDGSPSEASHREISEEEINLFTDLLGQILVFEPADRWKPSQILDHPWFHGVNDVQHVLGGGK